MKIVFLIKTIQLKQIKRFFPLVFAIVLLHGITVACKDKTPKPTPVACTVCEARTETKHYFLFDLGSWWVYEEESSHQRDSIYVTESIDDTNSSDFSCRLFSPYQHHYYQFFPVITVTNPTTGCTDDAITTKKCIYVKSSKYFPGGQDGSEEIRFFSQFYKGAETTTPNDQYYPNHVTFQDILDSYNIGAFSFNKVLKVHTEHAMNDYNSPTNYYYVKGTGLIRKEIIDSNQVWNLVDYHVTQ